MANLHAPGWVAAGIRAGLSARAALRDFRAAGGKIRDTVWNRLYAEQGSALAARVEESTAPLASVPSGGDIVPMTTKRRSGYVQLVDIFTRQVGTDVVSTRSFWITTQSLMSRGDALTQALTQMQTAVDQGRYDEVLLGGVYAGTREMTPGELQ